MREYYATSQFRFPGNGAVVTIGMMMQLDYDERYGSIGISMDPALLPQHLHDPLFFKGICEGILTAAKWAEVGHGGDLRFKIVAMYCSMPMQALSDPQHIQVMADALSSLAEASARLLCRTGWP